MDYLSLYALIFTAAFPLLSLAVSLPGMTGVRAAVSVRPSLLDRGDSFAAAVEISCRKAFPVSRVDVRLRAANLMCGQSSAAARTLRALDGSARFTETFASPHCGVVECGIDKLVVYDLLGLFKFRAKASARSIALSRPLAQAGAGVTAIGAEGGPKRAQPGYDYDVREYREGEPLCFVHWKLTSKFDRLIIREPISGQNEAPTLMFDYFGSPETLDRTLDALSSLSAELTRRDCGHFIRWRSGGSLKTERIAGESDFERFLWAALSSAAPADGVTLKNEIDGINSVYFVPPAKSREEEA